MENIVMSTDSTLLEQQNTKVLSKVVYFVKFLAKIVINFCLILLFLATCFVSLVFIDDQVNKVRGINVPPLIGAYVIVSPSMTPTIKVQDAVLVLRAKEYKVGDIITFSSNDSRYEGYTITHRIIDVVTANNGKVMYITKGDNNAISDSAPVYYENIYGKVAVKIPNLGLVQKILLNPYIVFFVVLAILLIVSSIYFGKRIKNKKFIQEEEKALDNDADLNIIVGSEEEIEVL